MLPGIQKIHAPRIGAALTLLFTLSSSLHAGVIPITTRARAGAFAHVDPNPFPSWTINTDFQSSGNVSATAHQLDSANANALSCEATTSTTGYTDPAGSLGNANLHFNWTAVNTMPPGNPPPSGTFSAEMKFFYSFFVDVPVTLSITINTSLVISGDVAAATDPMTFNHTLTVNGQFTDLPADGTTTVEYNLNPGFHQLLLEHYPNTGLAPWPNTNATTDTQMTFTIKQQGDMNCDGKIDGLDIQAFVHALLNPAAYMTVYPTCDIDNGDLNHDTAVTAADAPLLAQAILGS